MDNGAGASQEEGPLSVEVDYGSATSRGRQPGRAWLIRLRRGQRSVIIAWGLNRTSAESIAERVRELVCAYPSGGQAQEAGR